MKIPPLALGAGAGLLVLALLSPMTGRALGELAAARADRTQLAAAAALPKRRTPLVAAGLALAAPDTAAARAAMMARLQRLARAGGVLVEETEAIEAPEGLAALRIRVSGAEKAVLALADAFEREQPLMRFRRWSIEPVAGGVRLAAEAVAVQ
ncbi:hypothetical protein [Sphingomonas psychrotolerans]|uniref:Uncharacterized protein n=1 Tax=Sphingomonas psychrotolerans TaxID=1327635 RepID=A0A2K8MLG1_9SPHN|nr:hypothetical protein [Sphingomonas psychrotolerans]ATY32031.1 hypothetical protein CVN68_08615 [Sphingomonas psychrotolerans]